MLTLQTIEELGREINKNQSLSKLIWKEDLEELLSAARWAIEQGWKGE